MKILPIIKKCAAFILLFSCLIGKSTFGQATISPAEARAIAKEAYIYGFPMVDGYRIQHAYFINSKSPAYKCPIDQLANFPNVFTPEEKVIQGPNSDTPYSFAELDLRAELPWSQYRQLKRNPISVSS